MKKQLSTGPKKVYKKSHKHDKLAVNQAVQVIINDPNIGKEKKGDFLGIFVYKFKINKQEMLLAYEWDPENRLLIALGVHENFYRDLKR